MLRSGKKLNWRNFSVILTFLLLITCKSIASQSSTEQAFSAFLSQAERLKDSDPKAALLLLNNHNAPLAELPLISQLNYFRIQSAAYADQALYSQSAAAAEQGLKLSRQMSNPSIFIAELAYTKGFSLESLGDFDGAIELYQNGLDVARSMRSQTLTARGLINIGAIFYLRKDYKQSLITLNEALSLAIDSADHALLGDVNSELGILYGYLGDDRQANNYFQQAYQHFKSAGKVNYALNSLHNVAINYANQERYEQAIAVYRTLESEIQANTSHEFIASIYRNLAWALLNQKDADKESAYRYIMLAGEYVKNVEQHFTQLQYLIEKAYVLEKIERYQEALANIEQAEMLLTGKDNDIYDTSAMNVLVLRAKLHYALGQYRQAYDVQSQYFSQAIAYRQARETSEIDELRLQYQSETAHRQKNILEKKQRLQDLTLQQITQDTQNRQTLIALLAIGLLILAWFLYRVVTGQRNLIRASRTDSLTGVLNRRRLLELGQKYCIQAVAQQRALSICLLNIDDFQQLKRQFGHSTADKTLKDIAQLGQSLMRAEDIFGRLSGEQFIVLLPNTGHDDVTEVARRLCASMMAKSWPTPAIAPLKIRVGVATHSPNNYSDFNSLLKMAEQNLSSVGQFTSGQGQHDD
ncbi:diguanylate cyclase [Colwellia chukchiensis]|uniref:diguanylate cyclase n=1 Tax=Colwellia chukchiensis TaxID=641665 RepID=A0A1H7IXD8_9GAMM|nr:diguanylate cyclase [Colwellia chukchiensis]